jgi:hypothetical protein
MQTHRNAKLGLSGRFARVQARFFKSLARN